MFRPLAPLLLCALIVSAPRKSFGQESCDAPYVASDVTLRTTNVLAQDVEAATRAALIGECFNSPADTNLVNDVQQALRNMGYLRSTVSAPSMKLLNASHYPQRASLTFTVHEGARSPVHEIQIAGNNLIDADQIRSVVQLQLGEFLDMSKVRASSRAIQNLYRANGFSKMTFKQMVEFSVEPKVRVIFQINEGPRT